MIRKSIFICTILLLSACTMDKPYKDGRYSGSSRAIYTNEPYYGLIEIVIKKGRIKSVDFSIRDSSKHEYFDDLYERHFAGNDKFIQQCRNDREGVRAYPDSLIKRQEIGKVDAISGATWSYNLFRASAEEALSAAMPTDFKQVIPD